MERLTSDKSVSQMNMVELAYNSCYAKDGNARYRDFDIDIDARKLAIDLLGGFANTPNELTDDEDFDEYMLDCLQYGTGDIKGLIAILYRNMWAMADLRGRLKEYEDLEEQGLLLRLPCKIGDDIYFIPYKTDYRLNVSNGYEMNNRVYHQKVSKITFTERGWHLECDKDLEYGTGYIQVDSAYKETWFLTQEDAEQALAKMESEAYNEGDIV